MIGANGLEPFYFGSFRKSADTHRAVWLRASGHVFDAFAQLLDPGIQVLAVFLAFVGVLLDGGELASRLLVPCDAVSALRLVATVEELPKHDDGHHEGDVER